jgi:hypothetical protein
VLLKLLYFAFIFGKGNTSGTGIVHSKENVIEIFLVEV